MNLDELTQNFRMLGLEPGATLDQVKEAYRNSLQAFHPDKYPEGSSSQKWASDRLLLVNDANEKLKEFFKENPTGEPPGGWPNKGKKGADSASEDGSMDWEAWETDQKSSFSDEVKAWEKRQEEREAGKLDLHGRSQRTKMATFGKCAVGAILAMLWMGKCTNNQYEITQRQQESALWYMQQTGPIDPFAGVDPSKGNRPTTPEGKAQAEELQKKWAQEDFERNTGLLFLWVITGGAAWLFWAKRPKAVLENWVNTGQADWKELQAAATDAAKQARTAAEVAAKKTVEAAERLKVEAARVMEIPLEPKSTEKPPEKPKPTQQDVLDAYNRIKEAERLKKEKENDS